MIKRIFFIVIVLVTLCVLGGWYALTSHGVDPAFWSSYKIAKVEFDNDRIPTVEAKSWEEIVEAQGFLAASERLWQMELTRRFAAGRLSELFGEAAIESDLQKLRQNWAGVAARGYQRMSVEEKRYCDAYAKGVNDFIESHSGRWGAEFTILRYTPENWRCEDSLLTLISMAKRLSSSADRDLESFEWVKRMDQDWAAFLFPNSHPWNKPIFGKDKQDVPWPQALKLKRLSEDEPQKVYTRDPAFYGSNSWVVSHDDARFLVNDPHLSHSVPMIWYPMRLLRTKMDWVVGVSLPGIPGVIIGMNRYVAWGLTNVGEDVESFVVEEVNWDDKTYVEKIVGGEKQWKPLKVHSHQFLVKGKDPEKKDFYSTSRGPLLENKFKKGEWLARQWLPLKEGVVELPTVHINRSKNWYEFNTAADKFRTPAQNLIYLDRGGNIGYRTTGLGVKFPGPSQFLQGAQEGAWLGIETPDQRKRKYLEFKPNLRQSFSVANQRIWVDDHKHRWAADDRASRIDRRITMAGSITAAEMKSIQLDTFAQLHLLFRDYLKNYSSDNEENKDRKKSWEGWSGFASDGKETFTELDYLLRLFENILLGRVKDAITKEGEELPQYKHYLKRAWMIRVLENPERLSVFGVNPRALANRLMQKVAEKQSSLTPLVQYDKANLWSKEHPFVGRIPLLGDLFRVSAYEQVGFANLVRVETKDYGASTRLIMDMKDPLESEWSFPVGQSGHWHSPYYSNFRERFKRAEFTKMIPKDLHSKFF